ncbi:carbohydrate deacetylase [Gastrophryne carolinensis]
MPVMNPRIKLVVTGDDFGYCPRRDLGIVESFQAGAISNVSLLVNGSSASSAVELARRYNIPLGLHANLSEGIPVCEELQHNSTLINARGVFHGKMGIRRALAQGLLSMAEVRQEMCAQVARFRKLTGQNPQHMDGHQHVHVLPRIREEFALVLHEHGIPYTRVPVEVGLHRCDWIQGDLLEFYRGVESDALNTVETFKSLGIRWPDIYIGLSTMGKNMSINNIQQALNYSIHSLNGHHSPHNLQDSPPPMSSAIISIELMTHPGYPSVPPVGGCGEGPDDFSQSWERRHEMEVLKDPLLLQYYSENGIQLSSFKDL